MTEGNKRSRVVRNLLASCEAQVSYVEMTWIHLCQQHVTVTCSNIENIAIISIIPKRLGLRSFLRREAAIILGTQIEVLLVQADSMDPGKVP